MSTYLQLLKLAFWVLPLQRLCTVLGGLMIVVGGVLFDIRPGRGIDSALWGCLITFAVPALLGGAILRAVSAPRAVRLAPGGRLRLLVAAVGIAATVGPVLMAWAAVLDLGTPPQWRMQLLDYRNFFVAVFAGATWWALASFISSRSPLAMLLFLLFTLASAPLLVQSGQERFSRLWLQPWSVALPCALWAVFGIWYLRARRIAPPGWLLPGSQSVLATVAIAETANAGIPRRAALERVLLGGTSVPRLLAQWLLAGSLLSAVPLLMGREGDEQGLITAHMAFAALLLCPVIIAALAKSVVRRARVLWLPSGFSRGELFARTEFTLLKLALGMALVFTAFLLALWYTQPWRPATTLPLMLAGLFATTLLFAGSLLARPTPWQGFILILVLVPVVLRSFTSPLLDMAPVGTWWAPAIGLVAIVALRELARRRWLAEDLPRA